MSRITSRKRGDSLSSEICHSVARHGVIERLIDASRTGRVVGKVFVDDPHAISGTLASAVSQKACQVNVAFVDSTGLTQKYHGQGGLFRGNRLTASPGTRNEQVEKPPAKKQKTAAARDVTFEGFSSFEATPVTAKHNIESENGEQFINVTMTFVNNERRPALVDFPDGGCTMTKTVQVRPATQDEQPVEWMADDVAYGTTCTDARQFIAKKPLLFDKVPSKFCLRLGQSIGIAIYRTFDISHEDAAAPSNTDMESIYGKKGGVSVYTGQVKRLSENGQTFEHDINTFRGCSGAVIFLLDVQADQTDQDNYGMAVGIHLGGLPSCDRNLGFIISQ